MVFRASRVFCYIPNVIFLTKRRMCDQITADKVDAWMHSAREFGHHRVFISSIQLGSRRGTKAWILVDDDPTPRDSFFWWHRLMPGQLLIAAISSGYGPHTRRTDVIYIGREDYPAAQWIYAVITPGELKRWRRHHVRARRRVA